MHVVLAPMLNNSNISMCNLAEKNSIQQKCLDDKLQRMPYSCSGILSNRGDKITLHVNTRKFMHLANFWLPISTVVVADVIDVDIDLIPEAIAVYIPYYHSFILKYILLTGCRFNSCMFICSNT